ncbi:MAG TPA: hypothetical protein VGP63_24795 [Planctomycetaceae bacterium]|nr:hypothetical protein [Planctomycetaceae bacterium]
MQHDERNRQELNRRGFHQLATAAFGGVLAGVLTGCGDQAAKPGTAGTQTAPKAAPSATGGTTVAAATTVGQHACRGLNECKGQGKDHKNACAGQGTCFTVTHECAGQNSCNSQGGCGGTNGFNDCKEKGGCGHFPIDDKVIWKKARERFEARMKVASKKVGTAPAAAG